MTTTTKTLTRLLNEYDRARDHFEGAKRRAFEGDLAGASDVEARYKAEADAHRAMTESRNALAERLYEIDYRKTR